MAQINLCTLFCNIVLQSLQIHFNLKIFKHAKILKVFKCISKLTKFNNASPITTTTTPTTKTKTTTTKWTTTTNSPPTTIKSIARTPPTTTFIYWWERNYIPKGGGTTSEERWRQRQEGSRLHKRRRQWRKRSDSIEDGMTERRQGVWATVEHIIDEQGG